MKNAFTLSTGEREVVVVSEARQALQLLGRERFALLLSHIATEEQDGFALCEQVRTLQGCAGMPVLLFARTLELEDVLQALQSGVDGMLPEDCSPELLAAHVEQSCNSTAKEQEPSRALLFGHTRIVSPLSAERVNNLLLSCICHDSWGGASSLLPRTKPRQKRSSPQRLRVLLAEDNSTNRFYLVRLLENMGHTVVAVENGREALSCLQQAAYDVALMDIQMPLLDGVQAMQCIRNGEAGLQTDLPVAAITAHGLSGDRELLLQQGFDDYLSKPVEPEQIAATLEKLCGVHVQSSNILNHQQENAQDSGEELAVSAEDSYILDRRKTLRRLRDQEFVNNLYATFLNDLEKRVVDLQSALEQTDLQKLCKQAHTLKGAVSVLDAQQAREKAFALETAARHKNTDACSSCLQDLCEALEALRTKMKECLT